MATGWGLLQASARPRCLQKALSRAPEPSWEQRLFVRAALLASYRWPGLGSTRGALGVSAGGEEGGSALQTKHAGTALPLDSSCLQAPPRWEGSSFPLFPGLLTLSHPLCLLPSARSPPFFPLLGLAGESRGRRPLSGPLREEGGVRRIRRAARPLLKADPVQQVTSPVPGAPFQTAP